MSVVLLAPPPVATPPGVPPMIWVAMLVATWIVGMVFQLDALVYSAYVLAAILLINGWLIAFILSMPVTALKGWPMRTQAIFMGGLLVVLLGLAWINI